MSIFDAMQYDDLDNIDEDEDVNCYNYCNGFCTLYGLRCTFNGNKKSICDIYEEDHEHDM